MPDDIKFENAPEGVPLEALTDAQLFGAIRANGLMSAGAEFEEHIGLVDRANKLQDEFMRRTLAGSNPDLITPAQAANYALSTAIVVGSLARHVGAERAEHLIAASNIVAADIIAKSRPNAWNWTGFGEDGNKQWYASAEDAS